MTELWKEERSESRNIARISSWRENCYYTGVRAGMTYPIWHVEGAQERQVSDTSLRKYPCYQDSPSHRIVELVRGCLFYSSRMVPSQKVIDIDISDLRESEL